MTENKRQRWSWKRRLIVLALLLPALWIGTEQVCPRFLPDLTLEALGITPTLQEEPKEAVVIPPLPEDPTLRERFEHGWAVTKKKTGEAYDRAAEEAAKAGDWIDEKTGTAGETISQKAEKAGEWIDERNPFTHKDDHLTKAYKKAYGYCTGG